MEKNLKSLILFGHKGCGKTYFGRLLSKKINSRHVDTDLSIEDYFEKIHSNRLTCREIVLNHGEIYFRSLENHIIATLSPPINSIISVGGGTVLNTKNQTKLLSLGVLVYLKTDDLILKKRYSQSPIPSILDFDQVHKERTQIYEKIPSKVIETSHQDDETILEILADLLKK